MRPTRPMRGLSQAQKDHFNEFGYLVIEDVVDEETLQSIEREYEGIVDKLAPALVDEGKLSQSYSDLPFKERYIAIMDELDEMYDLYQHLDISLPLLSPLPPTSTMNSGPAVFSLLRHPAILDIAESIVGSEIFCNPVQHARIKPPAKAMTGGYSDSNLTKTPWHQDQGVINDEADETTMLTVWVAITDATVENGCMICIPGSHTGELTMHCPAHTKTNEIAIPNSLIAEENAVPMPVKRGGVVLLHQLTEHSALENHSDSIRWSFDLRYHAVGAATGRSVFPGFIARSEADPDSELKTAEAWGQLWQETKDRLVAKPEFIFNTRWDGVAADQLCA